MTKAYRGPYEANPKYLLKKSDDPTQQTIVCIHELPEKRPNWDWMEKYIKGRTGNSKTGVSDCWNELVGGRRAIFARMEEEENDMIGDRLFRKARKLGLRKFRGTAYPSSALMQEVREALREVQPLRFYDLLLRRIYEELDRSHLIYIISDQKSVSELTSPIYVGQTKQFLEQRLAGHKNADYFGFMNYARDRHEYSADWSVHVLSYEECRSFAIQGQLAPDLANEQNARQLLNEKYSRDHQWGLNQAETALITCFRPHFNKKQNYYPNPLQDTDYCEQKKCSICWPTPRKKKSAGSAWNLFAVPTVSEVGSKTRSMAPMPVDFGIKWPLRRFADSGN